jgi:hypothetical protein
MGFVNDNAGNTPVRVVKRAAASLPQTTTADIFSINGMVEILGIYGEVTTVIQTQANNTKLVFDPDSGAANSDICAVLNISADAVGTFYGVTGTITDAMQEGTSSLDQAPASTLVAGPGDIALSCAASNTGAIEWTVVYRPLEKISGEWAEVVAV